MYKIAGSIFETWGHVPMLATQKKPFSFLVVRNHIIGINMLHCTLFYCFPVTTNMKIWWNEWMCFTILLFTTSLLACGEWGVGNPTIDDGHFYFLFYNILTYILCIFMPYFLGYLIKRFIENPILKVHLFIHFGLILIKIPWEILGLIVGHPRVCPPIQVVGTTPINRTEAFIERVTRIARSR